MRAAATYPLQQWQTVAMFGSTNLSHELPGQLGRASSAACARGGDAFPRNCPGLILSRILIGFPVISVGRHVGHVRFCPHV
jgi:hypothetical protein